MTIFQKNLSSLDYTLSPLIWRRNVTTGRDVGLIPRMVSHSNYCVSDVSEIDTFQLFVPNLLLT